MMCRLLFLLYCVRISYKELRTAIAASVSFVFLLLRFFIAFTDTGDYFFKN